MSLKEESERTLKQQQDTKKKEEKDEEEKAKAIRKHAMEGLATDGQYDL